MFSEKELRELVPFFKSSIGQTMVEKNPDLMHVVMLLGQNRVMKIMPPIQATSDEIGLELKERVYEKV